MATIKSFTDLQQSKKLAEFLPLESADMCYLPTHIGDEHHFIASLSPYSMCIKMTDVSSEYCTPCWSLAALLGVLPDELTDSDCDVYRIDFFHLKGKYIIQYPRLTTLWPSLLSVEADNSIDACVAMIEKLNELKLL